MISFREKEGVQNGFGAHEILFVSRENNMDLEGKRGVGEKRRETLGSPPDHSEERWGVKFYLLKKRGGGIKPNKPGSREKGRVEGSMSARIAQDSKKNGKGTTSTRQGSGFLLEGPNKKPVKEVWEKQSSLCAGRKRREKLEIPDRFSGGKGRKNVLRRDVQKGKNHNFKPRGKRRNGDHGDKKKNVAKSAERNCATENGRKRGP